jgi:hypothetical protein
VDLRQRQTVQDGGVVQTRRDWLRKAGAVLSAGALGQSLAKGDTTGIPGLFRGRVVAVSHSAAIAGTTVAATAVRQIFQMGLLRLTEARTVRDAWAQFISPTDTVGIKINSSQGPIPISSPQVFNEVVQGVLSVGVPLSNIVIFDRYELYFQLCNMYSWIPNGVRLSFASWGFDPVQQDISGYDPDYYVDLPYVLEGQSLDDPTARRSYITRFATRDVTKIINLATLKDHDEAGVTLALKNISWGLVNNVNRGHEDPKLPHFDVFIPAIVSCEPIRSKVVLNIVDGIRGAYNRGPSTYEPYLWDHKTMYFATDPVAVDRVCWKVIDAKRLSAGLPPSDTTWPADLVKVRRPGYIFTAGAAGLGESDDNLIDLRRYQYGLARLP